MITIIKGGAGTGKTTRIKELYAKNPSSTVVVAPTNKAVQVLVRKSIPATTLHSALYQATSTGKFKIVCTPVLDAETLRPKTDLSGNILYYEIKEEVYEYVFNPAALYSKKLIKADVDLKDVVLIIDESSMLSAGTWKKLLTEFPGTIIAVGDPQQLPPIESEIVELEQRINDLPDNSPELPALVAELNDLTQYRNYFARKPTENVLTKVYRQAVDSAIHIVASSVLNTGYYPKEFKAEGVICEDWDRSKLTFMSAGVPELLAAADVVLCYRNKTCDYVNALIRSTKYAAEFEALSEPEKRLPRKTDKIYVVSKCKLADGEVIDKGQNLVIDNIVVVDQKNNIMYVDVREDFTYKGFGPEPKTYQNVPLSLDFATGKKAAAKMLSLKAQYGYAITCHKSQGSQWENVVVVDERTQHVSKNWRYTAATRAEKALVVFIWAGITKVVK